MLVTFVVTLGARLPRKNAFNKDRKICVIIISTIVLFKNTLNNSLIMAIILNFFSYFRKD